MQTSLDDAFIVRSTSPYSADCTELLLYESDAGDRRIVFYPKIVQNSAGDSRGVAGEISYERVGPDGWNSPTDFVNLNALKAGQGYRIKLDTTATHLLSSMLQALYGYRRRLSTVPRFETFQPADIIDQLQAASSDQVRDFVARTENADEVLGVLRDLDIERLQDINTVAGLATLKQALADWHESDLSEGERHWQDKLMEYPAILSQLFAVPTVIYRREAYLGGKNSANRGGTITDFLMESELTRNAVIVEIKDPSTKLLQDDAYRNRTYAPSDELAGGVQQVLLQRQTLVEQYVDRIRSEGGDHPEAFDPRCIVIVGKLDSLDMGSDAESQNRRQNFELYRASQRNVEIVTFDELFQKTETLISLLEDTVGDDSGEASGSGLTDQFSPPTF